MSGSIRQFIEAQRIELIKETQRLEELLLREDVKANDEENKENFIKSINYGDASITEFPEFKENRFPRSRSSRLQALEEEEKEDTPGGGKRKDHHVLENDKKKNGTFPPRYDCEKSCPSLGKDKGVGGQVENVPSVVEPLDLNSRCYELGLEERKQALIERLANSEGPFSYRSSDEAAGFGVPGGGAPFGLPVLRRGDYAPSRHAHLRAAPHEGLGEYEIGRGFDTRKHREYLRQVAKIDPNNRDTIIIKEVSAGKVENRIQDPLLKTSRGSNTELSVHSKSVQTDIENIHTELVVKHDLQYHPAAATRHADATTVSPRRTATDELVDAALRRRSPYRLHVDQRLTSAQNELLLRASTTSAATSMDKPKGILSNRRTGSPRDRYTSDLGHAAYGSSNFMDGFGYSDRTDDLERERLKRDAYQHELRLQIEEKRHLTAMRDDQERRERDLENRRLEQQLLRMREEQVHEDQRRQKRNELMRRHSDDLLRRKTELHEMQRPWRRHADSESANLDSLGLGTSSTYAAALGGYSPPVSRRGLAGAAPPLSPYSSSSYNVPATSVFPEPSSTRYNPSSSSSRFDSSSYHGGGILRKPPPDSSSALRRIEALNSYDTMPLPRGHRSKFDRFDSLSRIDSLSHRLETMSVRDGFGGYDLTDVQRRHSATQQDLSQSRSPRLRRRNSSSRFEDSLPIPVLKARSPVAKELRNAIPFSSAHRSSEAHRRLEDRWQIPAVQKNILHPGSSTSLDSPVGSRGGSILTQLGSIRAQLQREQLRMDETLRRRGMVRTRTTEDY